VTPFTLKKETTSIKGSIEKKMVKVEKCEKNEDGKDKRIEN
jgi:hypothetical protein